MRFVGFIALGVVVAFALLWSMQAMIGVEGRLDESGRIRIVDFVRLERNTSVEKKHRELPDKKSPETPPPPPSLDLSSPRPSQDLGGVLAIMDTDIGDSEGVDLGVAAGAGTDTDTMPLVRVEPIYPPRAEQRGIEGWVAVEFTITAAGTVKDPVIIAYYPSNVFNRAAIRAIRKWKYNPKIEDGRPVTRRGVRVKLEFEIDPQASG